MGAVYSYSDREKAIECYKEAININPKYVNALSNLGSVESLLGNYDKAIEYLQKATNLESSYAEAWNQLGVAYYNLKRYSEALSAFNKAIDLEPNDEQYKKNRDNVLANM